MTEHERLLKAAYFRSNHRGGKEADTIIGGFTHAKARDLTFKHLCALNILLSYDDHEILYWIECPKAAPSTIDQKLLSVMNDYAYEILSIIKPIKIDEK